MANKYTKETKQGLTFESDVINNHHASIIKSTTSGLSKKEKKDLNNATLNFFFGINRKQDNQHKTKQIKLF